MHPIMPAKCMYIKKLLVYGISIIITVFYKHTACTLACGNGEAANEFCDACILQNICQSDSPCQHGGVCIRGSGPDEYSCDCSQTNYIGINCSEII